MSRQIAGGLIVFGLPQVVIASIFINTSRLPIFQTIMICLGGTAVVIGLFGLKKEK